MLLELASPFGKRIRTPNFNNSLGVPMPLQAMMTTSAGA